MPENKENNKRQWIHIKRTLESAVRGCHWQKISSVGFKANSNFYSLSHFELIRATWLHNNTKNIKGTKLSTELREHHYHSYGSNTFWKLKKFKNKHLSCLSSMKDIQRNQIVDVEHCWNFVVKSNHSHKV